MKLKEEGYMSRCGFIVIERRKEVLFICLLKIILLYYIYIYVYNTNFFICTNITYNLYFLMNIKRVRTKKETVRIHRSYAKRNVQALKLCTECVQVV